MSAALGGVASLVGVFAGKGRAAHPTPPTPDAGGGSDGDVLKRHERRGNPASQPLDTMVLFERGDDQPTGGTREILSLVHEEKAKSSWPWTLYTSLATHHENGDACVHCARLHKHGPGWSAGIHSEVFNHARAVAIGANIEMSSDYAGGDMTQVIGVNIQAVGGSMQYGIQIHDNNEHAHFATAIGVNGHGKVGVDLAGKYDVGLHARGNSIRFSEGTCIELDDAGQVKIRYKDGRIEFLNGEKRVAYIEMNGNDHAL